MHRGQIFELVTAWAHGGKLLFGVKSFNKKVKVLQRWFRDRLEAIAENVAKVREEGRSALSGSPSIF